MDIFEFFCSGYLDHKTNINNVLQEQNITVHEFESMTKKEFNKLLKTQLKMKNGVATKLFKSMKSFVENNPRFRLSADICGSNNNEEDTAIPRCLAFKRVLFFADVMHKLKQTHGYSACMDMLAQVLNREIFMYSDVNLSADLAHLQSTHFVDESQCIGFGIECAHAHAPDECPFINDAKRCDDVLNQIHVLFMHGTSTSDNNHNTDSNDEAKEEVANTNTEEKVDTDITVSNGFLVDASNPKPIIM